MHITCKSNVKQMKSKGLLLQQLVITAEQN